MARNTDNTSILNIIGSTNVSDTVATSGFTSDPILIPINRQWSLNVFITGLTVTGANPTFTIFQTNTKTPGGLNPLIKAEDIEITPAINSLIVYKSDFKGQYMTIIYSSNGVTAGQMYWELYIEK